MICEIRHASRKTFKEYVRSQNQLLLVISIKRNDK